MSISSTKRIAKLVRKRRTSLRSRSGVPARPVRLARMTLSYFNLQGDV
jgi:hypothetical protein